MSRPPVDPRAYWEQRLARRWGLHGAGYARLGPTYNAWMYRVRRRVVRRVVRELGLELRDADVLDVGSGTGFYVRLWTELGARSVTASDFTAVAVERLRRVYPPRRVVRLDIAAPPDALPAFPKPFDLVSAFDVLFHIVDDDAFRRAVHNVARLCRPGGTFLFSENLPRRRTVREPHQVSRRRDLVLRVLDDAGFEVVKRVPMFWIMNQPVDAPEAARLVWRLLFAPVALWPALGAAYGAALYPVDLLLTRALPESPTTELVACRRR